MRRLSFPYSLSLLSVLLSVACSAANVFAANYPTIPYDATYRRLQTKYDPVQQKVMPLGVSDYRVATDGAGHVRLETETPNFGVIPDKDSAPDFRRKTITLFDYPAGVTYLLLEKQKQAVRTPLKTDASMAPIDDKRIKELNGKALGAEVKYGHPCHHWMYELAGVKTETWTADDLGCPIHTIINNPDESGEVLHLYKYDKGGPDPEALTVPNDFKVSDLTAGQPHRVQ